MRSLSLFLSIVIVAVSSILYILKSPYWYYPAVIGIWLLFDNLSHLRKNRTTLDLLINKDYKGFYILYFSLAVLGVLIELIGRVILNFWSYSYLNPLFILITTPMFYPFILMSFKETFFLVKSFVKHGPISLIVSMLIGIIIWGVPNVFSHDWVYTIPYFSFEVFHINIIIIFGWSILILSPVYIYKILNVD